MVANRGADTNKKRINITVFRRSYFNDFYRHFRKFWIEKKNCCCRYKIKFPGEAAIDKGGALKELYTGR